MNGWVRILRRDSEYLSYAILLERKMGLRAHRSYVQVKCRSFIAQVWMSNHHPSSLATPSLTSFSADVSTQSERKQVQPTSTSHPESRAALACAATDCRPEVRNQIYACVLEASHTPLSHITRRQLSSSSSISHPNHTLPAINVAPTSLLGLVMACKQTWKEFRPLYLRYVSLRPRDMEAYFTEMFPVRDVSEEVIAKYSGDVLVDTSRITEATILQINITDLIALRQKAPKLHIIMSDPKPNFGWGFERIMDVFATGLPTPGHPESNAIARPFDFHTLFTRLELVI
ncbi:hypothetical protein BDV96DRAFT_595891 [Lophiotrema nucula]|uniref:Uncharacterized protein n=1 Tax=Lophiotrema nucula TaxID=690887 RepID=A0A6A5ZMF1_9PLEO|nr:hypothetical protein BDV96DRAFT_595891 [Lophiotrema nucula]